MGTDQERGKARDETSSRLGFRRHSEAPARVAARRKAHEESAQGKVARGRLAARKKGRSAKVFLISPRLRRRRDGPRRNCCAPKCDAARRYSAKRRTVRSIIVT